jgi:hypothetical protein
VCEFSCKSWMYQWQLHFKYHLPWSIFNPHYIWLAISHYSYNAEMQLLNRLMICSNIKLSNLNNGYPLHINHFFGVDFCYFAETIWGKLLKPWVFSLKCICHKKFTTSVKSRLVKKIIALHHGNHSLSLLLLIHFLKKVLFSTQWHIFKNMLNYVCSNFRNNR